MKKPTLLLFAALLLFAGCNGGDLPDENSPEELTTVPALMVQEVPFVQTITVSGSLEPKNQSAVSAEASGTISELYVTEGDTVVAGQQLLRLAAGGNVASVDLSSAQSSLQNAERSLELTRQQVTESEKNAQLAVEQAMKNLENAKKTSTSTGGSVEAQIASAQSGVELAEITLRNAKKEQTDLQANLAEQDKSLQENVANTISSAITNFRSVLQQTDEIVGATDANERKNDRYEIYLGFRDKQTLIDSQNQFLQVWNTFVALETRYAADSTSVTSTELVELAKAIREVLLKVDIMLQNSISSANLSEAELAGFRATTTGNRNVIENTFQAVTAIDQQFRDYQTTKPQRTRSAEIAVERAEQQLLQSQKALEQAKSGGDVSLVGTNNQISSAQNALESTRVQLEIVRKQNEIAIQQSAANRDNARNSVDRAQTQFSKLSIVAPVGGVVTSTSVEAGQTVSMGAPLMVIAQVDLLTLRGDVSLEVLPSLKKGIPVKIEIDVFGERKGIISNIFPIADAATRRITIEIALDNSGGTIPANIFATATFALPQNEEVIMIPFKSLASQQPASVFVIGEGERESGTVLMIEKRLIETGRKEGDQIEVISGIAVGEIIVPEPVVGLQDGDIVRLAEQEEILISPSPDASQQEQEPVPIEVSPAAPQSNTEVSPSVDPSPADSSTTFSLVR